MKKLTLISALLLSLLLLVSCTSTESTPVEESTEYGDNTVSFDDLNKLPSCGEIASEIMTKFAISAEDFDAFDHSVEESRLDEGTISYFYSGQDFTEAPDFSHVTDYFLLVPVTTAATEIGIFKLDDEAAADTMKGYFANRAAARASTFAPYNEAESAKARDALISSEGSYVWYIMTDSNEDIEATILEMIK